MNMQPEVLDKIRKLLRLASSPNEHEAALALQRAQEIAIRNQIDIASLKLQGDCETAPKFEKSAFRSKRAVHTRFLYLLLIRHFNVAIVSSPGENLLYFIGLSAHIAFARWVYEFLDVEMPRLWKQYKATNPVSASFRSSYYCGVYKGLDEKLTENRRRTEEAKFSEIRATEGNNVANAAAEKYALALRDSKIDLDQAAASFFPNLRQSRASRIALRDQATFARGQSDGRGINISRPLEGLRPQRSIQ